MPPGTCSPRPAKDLLLSTGERLDLDLPTGKRLLAGQHPFEEEPTLDEGQRRHIRCVLEETGGQIAGPGCAAEILGTNRSSLYNRMTKLGLR